jgi:hypothetical protein
MKQLKGRVRNGPAFQCISIANLKQFLFGLVKNL